MCAVQNSGRGCLRNSCGANRGLGSSFFGVNQPVKRDFLSGRFSVRLIGYPPAPLVERLVSADRLLNGDANVSFVLSRKSFVLWVNLSQLEGPVGLLVFCWAHFGTRLILGGFRFNLGSFGSCQLLFGLSEMV